MGDKKMGDFTGLAEKYSEFRPDYSLSVLKAIIALTGKSPGELDFADVGAGTGIWTRMVAAEGCRSVRAVEPNDDMRQFGIRDSEGTGIVWSQGSGEQTGLETDSADLLSMASSFHWVDFDKACNEFSRALRPGGRFVALWNPRFIEANPLLVEIENKLYEIAPHIKRVSSGRASFTDDLTARLSASGVFDDVVYLEGRHIRVQTPEQYLGVWWSVNDIRAQAGEDKFAEFMDYIEKRISGMNSIETTYLTRAWSARNKVVSSG